MARTPRAHVSKTSGQGVSRLAYQKGYALRHPGDVPQVKSSFSKGETSRDYAKGTTKSLDTGGFNVSYGDTFAPSDLQDIKELGSLKAPKSDVKLSLTSSKKPK